MSFLISAQVIELGSKSNMLVSGVMEETGGIGVDCIIDHGGSCQLSVQKWISLQVNLDMTDHCTTDFCI